MFKKFHFTKLAIILGMAIMLAACGSDDNNNNSNGDAANNNEEETADNNNNDEGVELGDKDITIPYIAWAGSTARSPVLAKVLEEVGYDVDLDQVEAGPMFASTAEDEDTLHASGWFPATHDEYIDEYEDDIEIYDDTNLVDEAPLSLTVPDYVVDEYGIESIEDLKDNDDFGDDVDWEITGIDPGAGIMGSTDDALDNYDLDNWSVQDSSESTMISVLQESYEAEEPIIVTGWKPHWIFADMDLTMLEDPDEIYGGDGDQVNVVFNNDFEEAHPAAYQITKAFADDWDGDEDEDELMSKIFVDEEDEEDVGEEWVEENQDRVEQWTEGVDAE